MSVLSNAQFNPKRRKQSAAAPKGAFKTMKVPKTSFKKVTNSRAGVKVHQAGRM
jgi:hypothetical protein